MVEEKLIEIQTKDGRNMPVFLAAHDNAPRQRPGIIIVHEIFGLNDHIKDIARRFAEQGFIACAPDLFDGYPEAPSDRSDLNAMRTLWSKIPDDTLTADLHIALKQIEPNTSNVGVIGYCMGGAIAYMFACRYSKSGEISWVADYYGRVFYPQLSDTKPKHPIDYTDTLACPVLGAFAGEDELITADHVDQLEERIKAAGQLADIKIYPNAKHAFFNDTREFYNKEASEDAWHRTLDFAKGAAKARS